MRKTACNFFADFLHTLSPPVKGHGEQLIVKTITRREGVAILIAPHTTTAKLHLARKPAFDNSQNQTAENTNTENCTSSKNTLHADYSSVTS